MISISKIQDKMQTILVRAKILAIEIIFQTDPKVKVYSISLSQLLKDKKEVCLEILNLIFLIAFRKSNPSTQLLIWIKKNRCHNNQ